ncbi:MAG: carboxypeptidase regulatory-like domain-containing protein [Acidobacteria bacterium]|nr:carboxypeptidase regulatory-like domain-containing protein [Acidobacteriota bacterium]
MATRFVRVGTLTAVLLLVSSLVFAQGVTSSLAGTVVDTTGVAIPGATVVATNIGTGATHETVSSSQGSFSIPAMLPGTYSVTVTLTGFKTAVLNGVALSAGIPSSVTATLEVGGLSETVVVEGATAIIQVVSSAVSSTINIKQIESLPLTSRNLLDFVTFLPGVNTPSSNRNSTINGLPQGAINITLDGVNVQDNTLKTTDGFFTIVSPRLDAIEEITVSTAASDAAGGGQGAVQIRFTTRSGSNTYTGSLYHYFRSDTLNENTWFNIRNGVDKPLLKQNQTGARFGGPIVIPGLYDGRGKAFFFVNGEEFRQPSELTRNRNILHPNSQAGIFRYLVAGGVREVDLLALAAANGQLASMDPTIATLLGEIRAAAGTTGSITATGNPRIDQFSYNVARKSLNYFPTVRLDYNFTNSHRFSTVFNYHTFTSEPDTLNSREAFFPGFPTEFSQTSTRIALSNTLRSTLTNNIVNEARVAYSGAPVEFFKETDVSMWDGPVANQGGFQLGISAAGITNASSSPAKQSRNATTFLLEDTVSWLKGNHNLSAGVSYTRADVWLRNQTHVPTISFGVVNADPAFGMFSSANFPGSSSGDRTAARNLYAVLTGRVSQVSGNARLDAATGKYVYQGLALQEGRLEDIGTFVQDSWRVRSNLSINVGMRYDMQVPFRALNDSYSTGTLESAWGVSGLAPGCDPSNVTPQTCNIFKPGTLTGTAPTFIQLAGGTKAYKMDKNNFAPSFGFNWTPSARGGLIGTLMGPQGDFAIRGGVARSFQRNGMSDFTGVFNSNPGVTINVRRNEALGNLGASPLLFRDRSALAPPAFADEPNYPLSDDITGDIRLFDPNIQVPYSDTFTFGIQRGLTKNMAAEVRYVGTRSRQQWESYNYNELNIIENGFLDEFKLAQANLQANIAAGRGGNFRYYGPGTGTSPLPIYLAYFSGRPASEAGNAAQYTSGNFASATYVNPLARFNPDPFTAVNALDSTSTQRDNAAAAGLPANFIIANPDLQGGGRVTGHGGYTQYNSVQMELRRRLANGFQFQASYVYGIAEASQRYSFRKPRELSRQAGGEGEVTHALKANWVFELPVGRGKRWLSDAGPVLDRILGGWQIHGNLRVQSGRLVDFGNVRMVGFDENELRDMYKLRINENDRVFMLPQDVIDETIKAFSVSATSATGYGSLGAPSGRYFAPANGPDCIESISNDYGDCGERTLIMRGPRFREIDLSVMKLMPIAGRVRAEFRVEMLNAFNFVNYTPVTGLGTNPASYEISGLGGTNAARVVQLVSRITW